MGSGLFQRLGHAIVLLLTAGLLLALTVHAEAKTTKSRTRHHPQHHAAATPKHKTAAANKIGKKKALTKKHHAKKTVAEAKPVPIPKHVFKSQQLSAADFNEMTDAFNEADRQNWSEAMRYADRVQDKVAARLVLWSKLVAEDSGATLAEITAFREDNAGWPRQVLLGQRAEEALLAYPTNSQDIIAWFLSNPPLTGEGKIAYGAALIDTKHEEAGAKWIERGWVEDDFTTARQKQILDLYGRFLSKASHRARLARLLWDGRAQDARLTAALIGDDAQAFADARIKLASSSSDAPNAIARVTGEWRNDPGLLLDRVRYERRIGNDENVPPLLMTAPTDAKDLVEPGSWWIERRIAAHKAMSLGQYTEAYQLVSMHGLTSGPDLANAEFLAGWIALQYLNKPDLALTHFQKLKGNVSTPISLARAEYWYARAYSALDRKAEAEAHYQLAASYPTTFYGQLAIGVLADKKKGENDLHLPKDPKTSAEARARFENRELVHAAYVLYQLNRTQQLWTFMLHLADTLDDPGELVALADLAVKFDAPPLSLRIAKTAAQHDIMLPSNTYPISFMPYWQERGPQVERALVYGLSRQESEFDPEATSSAGARGLMQLMPVTARLVAKQIGVPYSPERLTDPAYNAMLGSAHLGDLVQTYTGSYVMSVAAYNAGKTRVADWVAQFGDPRSKTVDPIDWVESIPYSETRNYVQRVMENLQVYRTRLAGKPQQIRLSEDLRRNTGVEITMAKPTPALITPAIVLAPTGTAATPTTANTALATPAEDIDKAVTNEDPDDAPAPSHAQPSPGK